MTNQKIYRFILTFVGGTTLDLATTYEERKMVSMLRTADTYRVPRAGESPVTINFEKVLHFEQKEI